MYKDIEEKQQSDMLFVTDAIQIKGEKLNITKLLKNGALFSIIFIFKISNKED